MDAPAGAFTDVAQGADEARAVSFIAHNIFRAISAIEQMIQSTGKLNSAFAWHSQANQSKGALTVDLICARFTDSPLCFPFKLGSAVDAPRRRS
ncbi:MAG: hypothetical protein DLM52_11000 [Chthoniobacterales bacterium]|nr:MAG: hypothetical protein DLM52_11000 [Chthoniobacterales bacterium]